MLELVSLEGLENGNAPVGDLTGPPLHAHGWVVLIPPAARDLGRVFLALALRALRGRREGEQGSRGHYVAGGRDGAGGGCGNIVDG